MKPYKFVKAAVSTVAFVVIGALVLSACSSSASNPSSTVAAGSSSGLSTQSYTLGVKNTSYGKIIVDHNSMTLYMLTADTPAGSACTGACLNIWPPVLYTSTLNLQAPLKKSLVTTITLASGAKQIVYNGHPLYRYSGDTKIGQFNGEDLPFPIGVTHPTGHWYVMGESGSPVTSSVSTSSKGSSGYNY